MSAIGGVLFFDDRPVDSLLLWRMNASLAHRIATRSGVWRAGSVGFINRLLQTTPESLAEQLPLTDATGSLTITADARLDNRPELASILGLGSGVRMTDGELILAAYQRWGHDCPEQLCGDFAFAIWDDRSRSLFCARDCFGIRPFYYFRSDREFVFGSEIRALLTWGGVPRMLNESRVFDYLILSLDDKESTLFNGIRRLPPAHSMVVGAGPSTPRRYWSPDVSAGAPCASAAECAEEYRDRLAKAVAPRLRHAGGLGSMLSGGLDSSSVVCMARKLLAGGTELLHAISAVYDRVPASDERAFIEAVIRQGGLTPHLCHPDEFGPLTRWVGEEEVGEDEPLWNPQMALHWSVAATAREVGIRVLLDGDGGDEVVSHGVSRLTELARQGRWVTLWREARGLGAHFDIPLPKVMRQWVLGPLAPAILRRTRRALAHMRDPLSVNGVPLAAGFARRLSLPERVALLEETTWRSPHDARDAHLEQLTGGVIPFAMEVANRTFSRFGVEPRYPFFDRQLAEFCLSLPSEQKMHDGWTRAVARRALGGILPEEVRWRGGKATLGPAFDWTLEVHDKAAVDDFFRGRDSRLWGYVDRAKATQLHDDYRAGQRGIGFALWRIVMLGSWLEEFRPDAAERGGPPCD